MKKLAIIAALVAASSATSLPVFAGGDSPNITVSALIPVPGKPGWCTDDRYPGEADFRCGLS